MLKIEDVKVGDVVVNNESGKEYKIFGVNLNHQRLWLGGGDFILSKNFKFFTKKEQYTFDDLIDVAVKAKKDDVLFKLIIDENHITVCSRNGVNTSSRDLHRDALSIGIEYVKSLYKETFTIESEEDCKRIKQNAKITFLNGNSIVMDQPPTGDGVVRIWNDGRYDFVVLKGATVEQERGRDD